MTAPATITAAQTTSNSDATKPYDFKNPKRIAPAEKETIKLIHENYALVIEKQLGALLKIDVKVQHQSTEQSIFSEYLKGLAIPTCIAVVEAVEINGFILFEINSALIFTAVNRLLGGSGGVAKMNRIFTAVETSIATRIVNMLLDELSTAWGILGEIHFKLKEIQINSTFAKIVPDGEICVIDTFKVSVGEVPGLITVCIPYVNLEPLTSSVANTSSGYQVEASPEILKQLSDLIEEVVFPVDVLLGTTYTKMGDLLNLQVGDIINLYHRTTQPLLMRINTIPKFEVLPGLSGKYKAASIESFIEEI